MKKFFAFVIVTILILGLSISSFAQTPTITSLGGNPASGQVTCGNTATLLYSPNPTGPPFYGRLSITFQNQSTQPVYIAPRSDISTSNAGILLGTQYQSVTLDRSNGNMTWYCITGSSTATVGFTEER
jgi:hypothetical protein